MDEWKLIKLWVMGEEKSSVSLLNNNVHDIAVHKNQRYKIFLLQLFEKFHLQFMQK